MTKRVGNTVIIECTQPAKCTDCGDVKELRPYGKGGAYVCFECGMKDEAEMKRQFLKLLNGERDI